MTSTGWVAAGTPTPVSSATPGQARASDLTPVTAQGPRPGAQSSYSSAASSKILLVSSRERRANQTSKDLDDIRLLIALDIADSEQCLQVNFNRSDL